MTAHFRWISYLSYSLRYLRVIHFSYSSRSALHDPPLDSPGAISHSADIKWVLAKAQHALMLAPWTEEDLEYGQKEIKIWYGPRNGPYDDVEIIPIKPPSDQDNNDQKWWQPHSQGGGSNAEVDSDEESDDEFAPWM